MLKILDCGCAFGANSAYLASRSNSWHVTGVDFAPEAIEFALKSHKLPNLEFHTEDLLDTLKKSQDLNMKYDVIIDHMVSYTLCNEDYEFFLNYAASSLVDDGVLYTRTLSQNSDLFKDPGESQIVSGNMLAEITRLDSPFPDDKYPFRFESRKSLSSKLHLLRVLEFETFSRTYRNGQEYLEFFNVVCTKLDGEI